MKIISQNLRVDTTSDLHGAADRHTPIKDVLLAQDPDVIGFQEANEGWLKYLPGDFDGYSYIWTWRGAGDNNTTKGKEATPIFYKTDKFDLLESGTFWLSETPDTPSWCFNENMNRTVAWVKLRLKETGEVFCFFNTHYPLDEQSRLQSAAVLREKVAEICGGILPYFITADFNMSPDSPPYNSTPQPVKIDTLLKWPMIIYEWNSGRHMVGNRHFRERFGISLREHNMVARFDTHEAMVNGAKAGLGWASVPECIYQRYRNEPGLIWFEMDTDPMRYPVDLAWHTGRVISPLALEFKDFIRDNVPKGYFH